MELALDWSAPWFATVEGEGRAVQAALARGRSLPQALDAPGACPVHFVPQDRLPTGVAYEQFIFDTGHVPTRDNLHDFFNGLCWRRFPATKQRLNRLQAAEIACAGVGAVRGPVRDALTLFDENAALLQAPPPLWDALQAREWHHLFVTLRPLWPQARLVLFGHALLEKLVTPYKSITAHVFREPVPLALGEDLAAWDGWLADTLTAPVLAAKPFTPLPVLGVPGWWPANSDPAYYADAGVFRPRRSDPFTS
ncbi:DUF3025 domain-containing protein [Hydrogenophaga laconesensis]|uniref:DUF3025 domain-containing protein n=1 Tax=Hydrogenophaga laconesensis TaxID=1805971 RepID=A0ABU1VES6_9BURK|nr:DUF3025 domain-containing protein [Hydrogenophaga laconesensis]MDR7095979.1 hypothetical protein [Hydrogenophaga laconesensis]